MIPFTILIIEVLLLTVAAITVVRADVRTPGRVTWLVMTTCVAVWCVLRAVARMPLVRDEVVQAASAASSLFSVVLAGLFLHALHVSMRSRAISSVMYWILQGTLLVFALVMCSVPHSSEIYFQRSLLSNVLVFGVVVVIVAVALGVYSLLQSYRDSDNEFLRFRGRWFLKSSAIVYVLVLFSFLAIPGLAQVAHAVEVVGIATVVVGSVAIDEAPQKYLFYTIKQFITHESVGNEDDALMVVEKLAQRVGQEEAVAENTLHVFLDRSSTSIRIGFDQSVSSTAVSSEANSKELLPGFLDGARSSIEELQHSNNRLRAYLEHLSTESQRKVSKKIADDGAPEPSRVASVAKDPLLDLVSAPDAPARTIAIEALVRAHNGVILATDDVESAVSEIASTHRALNIEKPLQIVDFGNSSSDFDRASAFEQATERLKRDSEMAMAFLGIEHLSSEQLISLKHTFTCSKRGMLYGVVPSEYLLTSPSVSYYSHYPLSKLSFQMRGNTGSIASSLPSVLLYALRMNHNSLVATAAYLDISTTELEQLLAASGISKDQPLQRASFASFPSLV